MKKFLAMTLAVLMLLSTVNRALAEVVTKEVSPPSSEGTFTPTHGQKYVEAENSFDDDVVGYYLVTHDSSKKTLTSIDYKGETYPLTGVLYQANESFDFNAVAVSDGAKILADNGPSNITVFFDDGKYNDSNATNYTAFSRENNSYLGLNKDEEGESTAILSKAARTETTTTPSIAGLIERNIIMHKKVYFENLKFDGQNRDMVPVSYVHNGKTKKYRGEYFFNVTGQHTKSTDGLVMRDIVIENVGDTDTSNDGSFGFWSPDTRRKNVAINVHYNPGQINLENITIRNTRTVNKYGVIQIQDGDATYLKDIKIDMTEAGESASPIKVETTDNFSALDFEKQMAVVASLTLKTTNAQNPNYAHIYVQDYQYDYVKVPNDYRYAVWNTRNGDYFSASFEVYKDLLPAATNNAIQDLRDNYWVVDTKSSVSIEQQLKDIARVIKYTQEGVTSPKSPRANIKFIGDTIPSFNIPGGTDLWKNGNGSDMPIHIVAVKDVDVDVNTSDRIPTENTSDRIPTVKDFKAEFKNTGNTNLYHFDFQTNANYTADEVIEGVDSLTATDGHDGSYPTGMNVIDYHAGKDPAIQKATGKTSYNNCQFVGLVRNLNAGVAKNEIKVSESVQITTDIKPEETYTSSKLLETINVQKADNKELYYESTDPTIASVDENGLITGIKEGTVTIYVKAKDPFNQGEIEKPYYSVSISVKEKDDPNPNPILYKGIHHFVSGTEGKRLPEAVFALLPEDKTGLRNGEEVRPRDVSTREVITEGGTWIFQGFEPEKGIVQGEDVHFQGIWIFQKKVIDTTPISPTKPLSDKEIQKIIETVRVKHQVPRRLPRSGA